MQNRVIIISRDWPPPPGNTSVDSACPIVANSIRLSEHSYALGAAAEVLYVYEEYDNNIT